MDTHEGVSLQMLFLRLPSVVLQNEFDLCQRGADCEGNDPNSHAQQMKISNHC